MKSFIIIIVICVLCFDIVSGQQGGMIYLINGHRHASDQDLFFRSVSEWYRANLDSSRLTYRVDSLSAANGIDITEFNFPREINLDYIEDDSGIYDLTGKIMLDLWTFKANTSTCNFNAEITEMGIGFKANTVFINGQLVISDIHTEIIEPDVGVSGTGGFLCPLIADSLRSYIVSALREYLIDMADGFEKNAGSAIFDILNPLQTFKLSSPERTTEALESFPIDMKVFTDTDPVSGRVQLITMVNFLTGTIQDPNAFIDIQPRIITEPGFSHGGFSFLYWIFQKGFPWHTEWSETQRINTALHIMSENNIHDYRLEIRWRDLQKIAYLGPDLHPDSVYGNNLDQILEQESHWDTTIFSRGHKILSDGANMDHSAFMAIGIGHQDRMPDDGTGLHIAPATQDWIGTEGFLGISADEYLYNLKIYAHAVVREFADQIDIWQIENELNAAGFAADEPEWWRKGDLWLDPDFRNRVWGILVQAVRSEDPTGRIVHDLHMLGFLPAMESWIDDMDIIGVNFYPNQTSALPNLGFMVGEYIWAVRRVIEGLGYGEKPVWLVETGYPGIVQENAPDTLSLHQDMLYFSETRQAQYIDSALINAAENGADGFFYYSLSTQEDLPDWAPELNRYMRYSGLLRRENDLPKPGLAVLSQKLNNLMTAVSPKLISTGKTKNFILHQNFPNPFNPNTTIEYQIMKYSRVTMTIYNISGEEVIRSVSRYLPPGNYLYSFDGKDLASGIYFYELTSGRERMVKKMLLLK